MVTESHASLIAFLRREGYREAQELTTQGDFVLRGDTILVWPAAKQVPVRLHYLGDALETTEELTDDGWVKADSRLELTPNCLETTHGMLYPGDYVVHPFHGVGIFQGLIEQEDVDGEVRQYVSLTYAGNDRLLIPRSREEGLMPYIGSRHPRLTRLYSQAWARTKERVARDLIGVARGLLKIFAARQLYTRPAIPQADEWLADLAAGVSFSLTYDQDKALRQIQADLGTDGPPMDRLLCGDVGFGKTEVALRAAAQVIASGKQVAFLAPTTVLVEQHYTELNQRFSNLPVKVRRMSRLSKGEDAATIGAIADGTVDLVVGTHTLLRQSLAWKNLGMLIIDEEQKFGVSHKEKLKHLRPTLDVLSLSATPIPRTLSMSLSGLRGLSILRHPPQGRLPITTVAEPFSQEKMMDALVAELARGGQVYVVHHRVGPLAGIASVIKQELAKRGMGDAAVAVAHGQLPEQQLATEMRNFMEAKTDVLVASTIVEHGLDSARANTLIVLRSEYFGLSDLYQLRGRVGRRSTQAYAYFFTGSMEQDESTGVENLERMSVTAKKRLEALLEADTLGSGWSIAVRDLEIRGGGNILGNEQHGSMESIGLVLYGQLLQEEIGRQATAQGLQLFRRPEITD
jgi:transcription-repair coupling factor (superfamily II helicase)